MDRLDIDQEKIENLAEREFNASEVEDTDLAPEERRNRIALDDTTTNISAQGSLKRFDDVRLWDWIDGRVIGPGRGVNTIQVHSPAAAAQQGEIITCELDAVTDRAPVNQGETAMPVIPENPPPPPDPIDLDMLRVTAFWKIDQRSDALIAAGFEFNGVVFSCSLEAQIRMNAMLMVADQFVYPLEINALDDRSKGTLHSAQETQMWCLTALQHVKTVVDSGTVEKDKIRNAMDVAFIANYEDPRPLPAYNPYVPNQSIAPPANDNAQAPAEDAPLLDEA